MTNAVESWRAAARIGSASRGERLDEHAAAGLPPAAAPGELRDEREGPLLGAEVGEAQRRVGVEDDAQRDVGEVVALGDHLGPDENARRGVLEAAQDLLVGAGPRGAVGVEPHDLGGADEALEHRLDSLGPGAGARERDRAALGTRLRDRLDVAAVVAGEATRRFGG